MKEHWEYYLLQDGFHSFRNIHTGEKQHITKELPYMQYGTLVTLEFIER